MSEHVDSSVKEHTLYWGILGDSRDYACLERPVVIEKDFHSTGSMTRGSTAIQGRRSDMAVELELTEFILSSL